LPGGTVCGDGPCAVCDGAGTCGAFEGMSCGTGKVCHRGACIGNSACATGNCNTELGCGPSTCGGDIENPAARSECAATVEGGTVCIGRFFAGEIEANFTPCTGTGDCPDGQVCTDCNSAPGPWCIPFCGPKP
jgi:hypothetical protein